MNKKTLFIILLFFLLQNCGYTPIYKNIKNLDYNLNIVNISGNNDINNLITTYIQRYSSKSDNENINLNIKTEYVKNVLSKNKEGKIIAANSDNQFEFKKYENTIKSNFVDSAMEQLILKIASTE